MFFSEKVMVLLILGEIKANSFQRDLDISGDCYQQFQIKNVTLAYGKGFGGSRNVILKSKNPLVERSCSIELNGWDFTPENGIICVFQHSKSNPIHKITVQGDRNFSINLNTTQIWLFNSTNITIFMEFKHFLGYFGITITSFRYPQQNRCDSNLELPCTIETKQICIDKNLECDGNANCGKAKRMDEDENNCSENFKHILIMSTYGVFLFIIVALLIIQCFHNYASRRRLDARRVNRRKEKPNLDLHSQSLSPNRDLQLIQSVNASRSAVWLKKSPRRQ